MEHNDMQKTINKINSTTTNSNVAENIISNDNKKESTNFIELSKKYVVIFQNILKRFLMVFKKNNDNEKKLLQKFLKNLLRLHPLILSGISLVGMVYYFAYFGFELKYFPDLGGADVAYVGVSLFFMLATISLFFILPCLCYPGYHKKDVGWTIFFGLSLLPLFTLICMMALNTITIIRPLNELFWYSLKVSTFCLLIVICIDKFVTFFRLSLLLFFTSVYIMALNTITIIRPLYELFGYSFVILLVVFCIDKYILRKVSIVIIRTIVVGLIVIICIKFSLLLFLSIAGLYLVILIYFKGFKYFYNNNDFPQFVIAFIIVVFAILSWFVTNEFANKLGIANVEYKYLSIEKSALGALPKEICDITNINLAEENLTISYADNKLTIKDENNNSALCGNVFHEYIKFSCEDNECKNIKEATNIKYQNKNLSYAIVDKNTLKENNFTIGTTAKVTLKENITYIEKQNDVILLHNIKAISTLGKFYYLETIGYKNMNDKEIKFELDASKIISREKQER